MTQLVFNANQAVPRTHALVIGVGDYPHKGWGADSIDSAARSALAFSGWLADAFAGNTKWPLGTLDLLVSLPGAVAEFRGAQLERAATQNVFQAIGRWLNQCDASADDLAIFYFAGHGVEKGLAASLLMQDFGANAANIGDDALNLDVFTIGMDRAAARHQWFIVDACRTTPPQLVNSLAQFGRAGVQPDAAVVHADAREHLVLKSAAAAKSSYGEDGKPSRFTRALVKALDGAAWDDGEDPWVQWSLRSDRIVWAVNQLLALEQQLLALPGQSARSGGDHGGFEIFKPTSAPKVPLFVTCAPAERMVEATLAVANGGPPQYERAAGAPDPWEVALDVAQAPYTVSAAFAAPHAPVQKQVVLRPPCKKTEVTAP